MRRPVLLACHLLLVVVPSACISHDRDDGLEEDVTSGGKADQSGFPLGLYVTMNDVFADGEPVVAAFHPRTGNERSGETGQFDLVRRAGSGQPVYQQGTFKHYRYGGRDRIRFSSHEGVELTRTDWTYQGALSFDGSWLTNPPPLGDELVDCVAVQVLDSSLFEDALRVPQYALVSVRELTRDEYAIDLGSITIESSDAAISVRNTTTDFEARTTYRDTWAEQDIDVIVRVPAQRPRRGEILAALAGETPAPIARIVCR
jgi:hypothetical protein